MAMQATTEATTEATTAVQPTRHRFTVEDYYRMAEVGIFHEDSRVELIDGEIIDMVPIGPRHVRGVNRLTQTFVLGVDNRAVVSIQNPIRIGERNEPQPDLTLLRHREDDYATGLAAPEDVLLVVEVADSSAEFDRQTKAPMYARAGIADYWILDVGRDYILVYREPSESGYAATRVHRRGEQIRPLAFPDLKLSVDDILG